MSRLNNKMEPSSSIFVLCAAALLLLILNPPQVLAQQMLLPTTELAIGAQRIHAEVAATDASRNYGLMHRTFLPPDHGMLFVFPRSVPQCFWMKNTPLPLSIAFIDHQGVILNISDMQPYSTAEHCSSAAVPYALEMTQGWFEQRQIQAGQVLTGLPRP